MGVGVPLAVADVTAYVAPILPPVPDCKDTVTLPLFGATCACGINTDPVAGEP